MKRCLVTGASGLLGREVVPCLAHVFQTHALGFRQPREGQGAIDLRDPGAVRSLLEEQAPDAVVHLAAYRDPDFCEEHPEECRALNVGSVKTLCELLPESTPLLFVSTDYVFDGEHPPYTETSAKNPVSVYGKSKADAEEWVLARAGGLVLRVPLLIGAGDGLEASGFISQMRAAVLGGQPLKQDDVLVRFPTWTRDVAKVVAYLLEREASGIYHFSSLRGGTRYTWMLECAEVLGATADHLSPSTEVVQRKARRPPDSQLRPDRLQAEGYDTFTDFKEVVRSVLGEFGAL